MSPRRLPILVLGGGVLLLVLLAVLGAAGIRVMPSYLAAWLFVLSVPVGALLLVSALETIGAREHPGIAELLPPLRALLPLLPVAALGGLPVLLFSPSLYDPTAWPAEGIGRAWFARTPFDLRLVLFLLCWSGLALLFAAPARPGGRRGRAGLCFALTLVTGTLAALDWVMAVEPGLASSSFGPLVLTGQALSAIAVAALLARRGAAAETFAMPMLGLLAAWMFLHFSQFLVIWSANKPEQASWYLHRIGGLGAAGLWVAAAVFVLALALLPRRQAASAPAVAAVAGLILLVRLGESFWLVTPSFRSHLVVTAADGVALAALGAVALGAWLGDWLPALRRSRHASV